jgi:hypothetical protein
MGRNPFVYPSFDHLLVSVFANITRLKREAWIGRRPNLFTISRNHDAVLVLAQTDFPFNVSHKQPSVGTKILSRSHHICIQQSLKGEAVHMGHFAQIYVVSQLRARTYESHGPVTRTSTNTKHATRKLTSLFVPFIPHIRDG